MSPALGFPPTSHPMAFILVITVQSFAILAHWYFGMGNSLLWRTVLYIVACKMTLHITKCSLVAKLPSVENYYSRLFQKKNPLPNGRFNRYFVPAFMSYKGSRSQKKIQRWLREMQSPARKRQRAHAMEKQRFLFFFLLVKNLPWHHYQTLSLYFTYSYLFLKVENCREYLNSL